LLALLAEVGEAITTPPRSASERTRDSGGCSQRREATRRCRRAGHVPLTSSPRKRAFPAYSGLCSEGGGLSPSAARGTPQGLTAADAERGSEGSGEGRQGPINGVSSEGHSKSKSGSCRGPSERAALVRSSQYVGDRSYTRRMNLVPFEKKKLMRCRVGNIA
jgi:hypothetical protein